MTPVNARDRMNILLWGGVGVVLLGAVFVVAAGADAGRSGYGSEANVWVVMLGWLVTAAGSAMVMTSLVAHGVMTGMAAARPAPGERPPASLPDA